MKNPEPEIFKTHAERKEPFNIFNWIPDWFCVVILNYVNDFKEPGFFSVELFNKIPDERRIKILKATSDSTVADFLTFYDKKDQHREEFIKKLFNDSGFKDRAVDILTQMKFHMVRESPDNKKSPDNENIRKSVELVENVVRELSEGDEIVRSRLNGWNFKTRTRAAATRDIDPCLPTTVTSGSVIATGNNTPREMEIT